MNWWISELTQRKKHQIFIQKIKRSSENRKREPKKKGRHQQTEESEGNKMFIGLSNRFTKEKKKKEEKRKKRAKRARKKRKGTCARLEARGPAQD